MDAPAGSSKDLIGWVMARSTDRWEFTAAYFGDMSKYSEFFDMLSDSVDRFLAGHREHFSRVEDGSLLGCYFAAALGE